MNKDHNSQSSFSGVIMRSEEHSAVPLEDRQVHLAALDYWASHVCCYCQSLLLGVEEYMVTVGSNSTQDAHVSCTSTSKLSFARRRHLRNKRRWAAQSDPDESINMEPGEEESGTSQSEIDLSPQVTENRTEHRSSTLLCTYYGTCIGNEPLPEVSRSYSSAISIQTSGKHRPALRRGKVKARKTSRPASVSWLSSPVSLLHFFRLTVVLLFVLIPRATYGLPIRWELGPYGECTVTCGRGVQTRTVECRHMPEGPDQEHVTRGTPMPDMMCPAPKPEVAESCSLKACAPAWVAQPWGDCNRSCGRGQQTRELVCMQRLGTGETVRVPDIYCSRITPDTKRFCAMHNCPARYIVRPWSRCPPRCGTTYSTRQIACVQLRAGKLKPAMVDIKKCFKNRRPLTRKLCKKPGCPVIRKSKNANFVQTTNESKVRLQVGTTASVFPRTTVIVRCKVDRFRKQDLQWRFRGSVISNMGGHLSVLRDNSLRIVRAVKSDEGIYICAAGNVRAKFVLKIITNDTERGIPTTRSSMTTPIHRRQEIKTKIQGTIPIRHRTTPVKFIDNIDSSESDTTTATRFHFPRTVSMMPRQPPPPRIIVPSLSYVKQQAPIEIDARLSRMPSDSPAVPIHREVEHAEVDEIHDLNRIPKYSTNPPHFQGPISEEDRLLHEALSQHQLRLEIPDINILEQFQTALNEEEVDDIYLPMITDDDLGINRQRSGIRSVGNTAVVKAIGGLGERRENTRRPSIPSQPTVTPRQLAQEVTVYVGSSLIIVAGVTERITILCESNGDPVPVISWYRDNIRLPMENNRRQYVLEDGALRLLYPHTSDTGSYVCVASNRFGNDSRTTALTVTHKPRILSTTEDLEDFESELVEVDVGSNIQAKLGAKIRIRCPTEGFPEPYIRWTKDGPGLSTNSIIQTDNTLEIFPARKADQGLFSCEASNPAGSDYQVSSLILVEPPHISEILSERPEMAGMQGLPDLLVTSTETQLYKVKINGAVMMGCPVTGFPEPQLTWFFNDTPIYELGSTLDYQLIKKGTILQIPNANAITEGEYTCQAGNDGGNLTTSLRLSIVVYSYQFGENTPCTATCGDSGFQYRRLMCMEDGVKEVDEWYCTGVEKPTAVMTPCGRQDCPPRYLIRGWGSCSASCGNGTRSRILGCGILMSDGSTREVALELCGFNETRPVTTETCYAERCPRWHVGAWRRCSRKCIGRNMSARTRKVICVSGNGTTIGRKACKHLPKPRRRTLCPNPRCKPVWVASKWSVCSKPCGNDGIRTRILNCVYRGRKRQLAGAQCSKAQRPLVSIRCNRFPCRKDVHLPTPSNSPPCVNRFHKCRKIGRAGLCLYYKRFCCQTCS